MSCRNEEENNMYLEHTISFLKFFRDFTSSLCLLCLKICHQRYCGSKFVLPALRFPRSDITTHLFLMGSCWDKVVGHKSKSVHVQLCTLFLEKYWKYFLVYDRESWLQKDLKTESLWRSNLEINVNHMNLQSHSSMWITQTCKPHKPVN